MSESSRGRGTATAPDLRRDTGGRAVMAGVAVRESDIEAAKGIRAIAILFRGMAILLLLLMVLQVAAGLTSAVPISIGVLAGDAVRLVIFAGLLWGAGDLAVLWIKSHYDLRATRILVARIDYMMRQAGRAEGRIPPPDADDDEHDAR